MANIKRNTRRLIAKEAMGWPKLQNNNLAWFSVSLGNGCPSMTNSNNKKKKRKRKKQGKEQI
jgi:hypothetical protein